jgi:hypothetical protein
LPFGYPFACYGKLTIIALPVKPFRQIIYNGFITLTAPVLSEQNPYKHWAKQGISIRINDYGIALMVVPE